MNKPSILESFVVEDKTINIRHASLDMASSILKLQKNAYLSEAPFYKDYTIDPLTQTLEEKKELFADHTILVATHNEKIIGSVKAKETNKSCFISKLMVDPNYQNHSIGKKLMSAIENEFSHVFKYELYTGYGRTKNINFYLNQGYKLSKVENYNSKIDIQYLEKINTK